MFESGGIVAGNSYVHKQLLALLERAARPV